MYICVCTCLYRELYIYIYVWRGQRWLVDLDHFSNLIQNDSNYQPGAAASLNQSARANQPSKLCDHQPTADSLEHLAQEPPNNHPQLNNKTWQGHTSTKKFIGISVIGKEYTICVQGYSRDRTKGPQPRTGSLPGEGFCSMGESHIYIYTHTHI